MNRNAITGTALVILAAVLALLLASSGSDPVRNLLGKASWYLPYGALVAGIGRLIRIR